MSETVTGGHAPPTLWDPVVRLTHWSLAIVVLLNTVVNEAGSVPHVLTGWAALAILALRLVWGVLGPTEARFSAFPPAPKAALTHLADLVARRPRVYPSHNPAGALMVYTLWATLAVLVGTGIAMTGTGPLGTMERSEAVRTMDWSDLDLGESRGEAGEWLEEVHEMASTLILVLAALHVVGVAVESRATGRNLVPPMLTGRRRPGSRT